MGQPNLSCRGIIEQVLLEAISMHIKDKKVMKNSQHGFTKVRSGLTAFYIEMTGSVDRGRVWYQFEFDFSKPFDTDSHINPCR